MRGDEGGDALETWAERTGRRRAAGHDRGALRFAFYGRVSTEDWQDPVTSRVRQRDQAGALVVAALADPDRGWDAIVIGEYERAFYTPRWRRCSSTTASSYGLPKSAGRSTTTPRTTSRPCSR